MHDDKQSEAPRWRDWLGFIAIGAMVTGYMALPVLCTPSESDGGGSELDIDGLIAVGVVIGVLGVFVAIVGWIARRGEATARARADQEMRELDFAIASKPKFDRLPSPTVGTASDLTTIQMTQDEKEPNRPPVEFEER